MQFILTLITFALASTLSAQVLTATASLGAQGQSALAINQSQTTPAGSPIPPTQSVAVTSTLGYTAHSSVSFTPGNDRQLLTFQNGASSNPATCFTGQADARCHAVVMVQCAQPVQVRIRCDLDYSSLSLSTTLWQLGGAVDVGDDGTAELQWASWLPAGSLAVTLPAGTTPVAFHSHASVNSGSVFWLGHVDYTLWCSIEPDPNWTTAVTPRCDALSPELQPQPTYDRQLELRLSTIAPPATTIGAFVLGLAPANLTLPLPPGCVVGCRPDSFRLVFFDAQGQAERTIDLQVLLPGADLFAQGLTLDALGNVRSSELVQTTRF